MSRIKGDSKYKPTMDGGCHFCGGGLAIELANGLGVTAEGKAFHTECVGLWGESQDFTAEEMGVLMEQAFG